MKKILKSVLISIIIFLLTINPVLARAGGGTRGGGTSSSSSGGTSTHSTNTNHQSGFIENLVGNIIFIGVLFSSTIILKAKLTKSKEQSKRKMKAIAGKDNTWNYKELDEQVVEAYFVIQEGWKNNDLTKASKFMSTDLIEQFQTKLNWMEMQNKKNIMDKIELIEAFPISVYDDLEDEKDFVWYYIKGKMIDYIIDTKTGEKLEGNTNKKSFIEYWQFKKNKENQWLLSKILQEDEKDNIPFQE